MKLVVGLWCSRGLSSLRDPCEVLQKLRILTSRQSPALVLTDNEFCHILECSDYSDLHQSLREGDEELKSPLEVAAAYILGRNIRVARLAVESEENVFTESLQGILRRDLSRNFPAEMKVGRWSQRDRRTVLRNLSELQHQLSLSSEDILSILDNSSLTEIERNGRYLNDKVDIVLRGGRMMVLIGHVSCFISEPLMVRVFVGCCGGWRDI